MARRGGVITWYEDNDQVCLLPVQQGVVLLPDMRTQWPSLSPSCPTRGGVITWYEDTMTKSVSFLSNKGWCYYLIWEQWPGLYPPCPRGGAVTWYENSDQVCLLPVQQGVGQSPDMRTMTKPVSSLSNKGWGNHLIWEQWPSLCPPCPTRGGAITWYEDNDQACLLPVQQGVGQSPDMRTMTKPVSSLSNKGWCYYLIWGQWPSLSPSCPPRVALSPVQLCGPLHQASPDCPPHVLLFCYLAPVRGLCKKNTHTHTHTHTRACTCTQVQKQWNAKQRSAQKPYFWTPRYICST